MMSTDQRLRLAGYRITARPNHGEAVWTLYDSKNRPICTVSQSNAVATLARFNKDHTPRGGSVMRSLVVAIMALMIGAALACAKPDRETPKKSPASPIPATCQYGKISVNGKSVSLAGPIWIAEGKLREDGSLFLLWTEISSGRIAPSIYRIDEKGINGLWGWSDEVFEDEGVLKGTTRGDTIRE